MALWVHGFNTFETCDLACSEIEKASINFLSGKKSKEKIIFT